MQEATDKTVLGNFDDATFTHFGVTTTFSKRDGKFYARTDGPDGKLHEYPIAYTFGVYPLQQYLIPFPGGRYQALNVVWDTRPATRGRTALVPPLSEGGGAARRSAALDRAVPELELHVRRLPLDEREEGLLGGDQHLRDDLVGAERLLRGLPRAGLGARGLGRGRQGGQGEGGRRRQGAGRHAQRPRQGDLGLRHEDRHREAQRPADLGGRRRDLRALPRAAVGGLRRLRLRPAADADAPADAARRGVLLRRRTDPGRGLRVRLLPPEQDARGGRDVHELPQSARPEGPRLGGPRLRDLPPSREVRHADAHVPQGRLARRALRRLPHADARLHGRARAPRPQLPRAAAGPVGRDRHAERLHAVPPEQVERWAADAALRWWGDKVRQEQQYGEIMHAAREQGSSRRGGAPAARRRRLQARRSAARRPHRSSRAAAARRPRRRSRGRSPIRIRSSATAR